MTLPLNSRLSALYDTNGTQRDFSFGFRVFFDPDNGGYGLEVRRQTADGYEVIPKSDYLVLPVEDNSAGIVRFSVAPSAGQQIYIAGKTPTIQQLVLTNFGRYSAESIETQFDFITAIIQEWLSALGEETRQRIAADEILTQYVVNRIDDFVNQVNQNWDDKSQEIEDYIASIMPSFTQTLREEIEAFAVAGMQDAIDQTLADSKAEIDDAVSRANAAATAAAIIGKLYDTPEAGVDPVTGVADGAYFNVRSPNDESYVDEYQNIGGVPTPSGKSYPASQAVVEVQQIVAAVGETVASVDGKLKRENISVWDFFTPAELSSYKAAPANFDATRPIQEFFTYVANNDVGACYASGEFRVSNTIYIGGTSAIKTRKYNGLMTLYALNAIDKVAVVNLGTLVVWSGGLMVYGTGSTSFASRTCRVGIAFGGDSDRTCVDFLFSRYFYEIGVQFYNKSTLANIGTVKSIDCGSGLVNTGFSLTSTYTLDSNTGSQGSAAQQSILSVPTLPPVNIETIPNCVIGDQVYTIQNVDRVNNKITVHPWIDSTIPTGTLRYAFGGGLDVNGGDSSVLNIGVADLMRNGVGYNVRCLYPPTISELCCQSNGLGIVVGSTTSQAIIGGVISQYYCEGNNYDLIPMSRGAQGFTIQSTIAFKYEKIRYVAPRTAANTYSAGFLGLFGININDNGVIRRRVKSPENFQGSSFAVNVVNDVLPITIRRDAAVIALESDNERNAAFGTDSTQLTVLGTSSASGYKPTSVTFNPSSGYTVNGSASAVFNGFADVPTFSVFLDMVAKNYIVTLLNSYQAKSATVTYDPPSLAAGSSVTTPVALAGAVVGDVVQAAFSQYNSDVEVVAAVSSANTVTVKFKNTGSSPVDLASGSLKVRLV